MQEKKISIWQQNFTDTKHLLQSGEIITSYSHRKLYAWLKIQQKYVAMGNLTSYREGKIKELNKIISSQKRALDIKNSRHTISIKDIKWTKKLQELKDFRNQHPDMWPRLDSEKLAEKMLAQWCNVLRVKYRECLLEDDWIRKLKKINFAFEGENRKRYRWEDKFNKLVEFRKANPTTWPSRNRKDEFEKQLGIWCQDLRTKYKEGKLNIEWFNRLKTIEFNFEGCLDNWKVRFYQLKDFLEKNGELPKYPDKLYTWTRHQCEVFDRLNPEQRKLLRSIQVVEKINAKRRKSKEVYFN
jgi:hypothetical protein